MSSSRPSRWEPIENTTAPPPGVIDPQSVGYDTKANDAESIRSRLMAGNLSPNCQRNDLIVLFAQVGQLRGLSLYKGYAFIQYFSEGEALEALRRFKGHILHGAAMDLKTVVAIDKNAKKPRPDDIVKIDLTESSVLERPIRDPEVVESLEDPFMMADTLLCGGCGFVTCELQAFRDHRTTPCSSYKNPQEPAEMLCAACGDRFDHSWRLLLHLRDDHRMRNLFTPGERPAPPKRANIPPPPMSTPIVFSSGPVLMAAAGGVAEETNAVPPDTAPQSDSWRSNAGNNGADKSAARSDSYEHRYETLDGEEIIPSQQRAIVGGGSES